MNFRVIDFTGKILLKNCSYLHGIDVVDDLGSGLVVRKNGALAYGKFPKDWTEEQIDTVIDSCPKPDWRHTRRINKRRNV